ncbi:hypothetical protein [Proteiniclasticum sp. QWL-01]|uniref:hypothetical protein n=1 Tax=Proteiniclasticum sp. QWL-01 TaxID=3036945 RepID=UPI00240EC407|nr:hypothetical protein [Proteiniclasticum sp. QWL-01]WFF72998.1 hypothetical protein P6M73_00595 [Proteiniclasticum sp. QWL-01]
MDWKEIGFNSEEEMKASIERVQRARRNPPSPIQQGLDNKSRLQENMDEHGRLDLNAISEGARLEELDKVVASRLYQDEQRAKEQKRTDAINDLLKKVAAATKAENEAKAQAAIDKEKAEAIKAIEEKHKKENGVFVDPLDDAYRALLK